MGRLHGVCSSLYLHRYSKLDKTTLRVLAAARDVQDSFDRMQRIITWVEFRLTPSRLGLAQLA